MELLIALLVAPILIVTAFLCIEIAVGLGKGPQRPLGIKPSRTVVVVPAHNEERGIRATLAQLRAEADGVAEILVVADNCSDGTARIARCLLYTSPSPRDS